MSERDIIDRWGTSEQYHEELRTFMEQHKNAPIIVVSTQRWVMMTPNGNTHVPSVGS